MSNDDVPQDHNNSANVTAASMHTYINQLSFINAHDPNNTIKTYELPATI